MKCHYEVLGVAREATAAELKTVYRKLALQWHPDKNPDNLQEAKEQFQSIQNAYEVLSDPQERAWYDNHREQLLRGAGSSYNDCSLDVFPYFSPSCYKGFADDPQGFYAVYSEVFSKLASEETDYLEDPEDVNKIPKFGSSSTVYEDVHEFYAFWMAFSTNKSYVWLDQHEISQSDNRRVIKLMEKENSKIRQRARRERNEEIRRLVSFVRRRDKRVQLHIKLLQEKADDNKKKAEQLRRERIIQRQKEIEEAQKKQGESSFLQSEDYQKRLAEIENQLQQEFGVTSDDDTISEGGMESSNEDSSKTGEQISETSKATPNKLPKARPIRNLYCSACKKLFKNVKSFENHENSRKHQENVANLDLEQRGNTSDAESEPGATPVNGREDAVAKGESTSDCAEEAKETLSDESAHVEIMKSQKKKRNKRRPLALPTQPESEGNDSHDEMSYTELEAPARARRNNKLASMKSQHHKKDTSQPSETAEPSHPPTSTDNEESIEKPTVKAPRTNKPKKPDKKDRPAKVRTEIDDPNLEINLQCAICRSTFPSKNKLFDHLKKTGHSIALPQMASAQKKGKRVNR